MAEQRYSEREDLLRRKWGSDLDLASVFHAVSGGQGGSCLPPGWQEGTGEIREHSTHVCKMLQIQSIDIYHLVKGPVHLGGRQDNDIRSITERETEAQRGDLTCSTCPHV